MDLRSPIHLGGDRSLVAVSVGRDPDDETVEDCPVCGGYCYHDRWHLVATTRDGSGTRRRYRYCSGECLDGWLRTATA